MDTYREPNLLQPRPGRNASEAQRVRWMLDQTKVPSWLERVYRKAKQEREYLHTEAFAEDDEDRVSCNDLLRAIWAKMALVWPQNPEASVKPSALIDPPMDLPPAILALWERSQAHRDLVARSVGGTLNKMASLSRMEPVLQRGCLDAFSVGLTWVKAGWMEDPYRDVLGRRRTRSDAQDQLARLRMLERDALAGRFGPDDKEMHQLAMLRDYARRYALDQIERSQSREERWMRMAQVPPGQPVPAHLLPEPTRWQCGTVDLVDLENVRLDWERVTCPEFLHLGRHLSERVWMSRDEAATMFELTEEEREKIGRRSVSAAGSTRNDPLIFGASAQAPNPADDDLEQAERVQGDVAVWEWHDQEDNRIYWFTEGVDRYLRTEVPEVTPPGFFSHAPLFFNPVAGRFSPVSDTTLGRKLQEELNQTLTDDREARIARYPFYGVLAGVLSEEDIRAIEGRRANKVVQLSRPASEVKSEIVKIPGDDYNAELYQIGIASSRANLERQVGVPTEALQGVSRPKFATQTQVADGHMSAQAARASGQVLGVMRWVFECWAAYVCTAMSAQQVKTWLGPWAELPEFDRDQIAASLIVEVVSAGNRSQRKQDLDDLGKAVLALKGLYEMRTLARQFNEDLNIRAMVQRIESAVDLRLAGGMVKPLPAAMTMGMPGGGMPGGLPGGLPGGQPVDPAAGAPAGLDPRLLALVRAIRRRAAPGSGQPAG